MLYLLAAPSTLEGELSRASAFLFPYFQSFIASFPTVAAPCLLHHWYKLLVSPQTEIPHLPGRSSGISFLPHGTICHYNNLSLRLAVLIAVLNPLFLRAQPRRVPSSSNLGRL